MIRICQHWTLRQWAFKSLFILRQTITFCQKVNHFTMNFRTTTQSWTLTIHMKHISCNFDRIFPCGSLFPDDFVYRQAAWNEASSSAAPYRREFDHGYLLILLDVIWTWVNNSHVITSEHIVLYCLNHDYMCLTRDAIKKVIILGGDY